MSTKPMNPKELIAKMISEHQWQLTLRQRELGAAQAAAFAATSGILFEQNKIKEFEEALILLDKQ